MVKQHKFTADITAWRTGHLPHHSRRYWMLHFHALLLRLPSASLQSHLIDQRLPVALAPPGRIHLAPRCRTKLNNDERFVSNDRVRTAVSCTHRRFASSKRIRRSRNTSCITSVRVDVREASRRICRSSQSWGQDRFTSPQEDLISVPCGISY